METLSYFYTKPIIRDYYEKIRDVIPNKVIYNQDDIIDYFISGSESTTKEQAIQYLQQSIMRSDICQASIGQEYISKVLEKLFHSNFSIRSDLDICFILNGELNNASTIEEKFAQIAGFCIVKRGDCPKYGKAYTLNLVCSKRGENVGATFVGLYLYAILMHPLDTSESLIAPKITKLTAEDDINTYYGIPITYIGLLELSGGYKNIPGLCLYSKFGFKIDASLSGRGSNCFVNNDNLGMKNMYIGETSINIEERKTKIINIVKRLDAGFDKHVICNVTNKEEQRKMVEIYNQIKAKTEELKDLTTQSKFAINKAADGSLKAEFKANFDRKKEEINELEQLIVNITSLSISGGKSIKKSIKKKKTIKKKKMLKKRKTKRRY